MGKNFLQQQAERDQKMLDVGENLGIQKMWDYICIVLHDPEYMGKDTFSKERLRKIYGGMAKYANHFHTAFTADPEADVVQRDMEYLLGEIWGGRIGAVL